MRYLNFLIFGFLFNFQGKSLQVDNGQPPILKKERKKMYTADELRELLENITNSTS